MASSLQRLSALVGSQLRRQALTRSFRTTSANNAAKAMMMPAMSPTMTEGAISSWKVKEGDSFSAGDVLLEIETDKAQMDVEAQDDGIMAKIITPAGSKGVAVGTRIAVLAEEGDDLSTLEIPAKAEQKEQKKEEITPEQPKKDQYSASEKAPVVEASAESTPDTSKNHPQTKRPQHPSPSVMSLLKENNISAEASARIVGTGPKGRLLKGDILAHLGKINKSAPGDLEARIKKMSKLDLSNIKIAPPKPKPAAAPKKEETPAPPKLAEIKLPVNFSEVARAQRKLQVSLSRFIDNATAAANAALPPLKLPPTADELFNDILGLPNAPRKATKGSFTPEISPLPGKGTAVEVGKKDVDIFDILVGNATTEVVSKKKAAGPTEGIIAGGENLLSLKVPVAEEERARVFLGRVKTLLERRPEQLVL
ncbi:hypothetical protein BDD12DRAFT_837685 [Trichophaea hybrida]|nr:hypothetical protein BDD12DRAFT_837685 [Trichophaea hybrida]